MLAEKFFLVLETILSRRHSDEAPRVASRSPHIPVELPANDVAPCRSEGVLRPQGLLRTAGAGMPEATPQRQEVLSRLAMLPDHRRAVLLLVAGEGLSYSAAAKMLDLPIGVVMSYLSEAHETLQRQVEGRADVASSNIVRLRIPK
jgi:DNA-directed RNA polymerase specialized sigma24 family protein